ncbi:hypothetical protein [Corynebacterium belfantii]|nr:hypothetical protein [Corynebacterium belfantii]
MDGFGDVDMRVKGGTAGGFPTIGAVIEQSTPVEMVSAARA